MPVFEIQQVLYAIFASKSDIPKPPLQSSYSLQWRFHLRLFSFSYLNLLITHAKWDGLKGYLTNTDMPSSQVYDAYHNLWHVERAFRISKSKIEIRPMFHFTRRRIEAHLCICFVALKVYKELERLLKQAGINTSVDKVLALAQTIVTIQLTLPQNKQTITRTMLMKRHQRIAPLFSGDFWGTH